jgi:hypothetical protein
MASAPAPHIEQNLMPEERLIATTRIHHAVVKIPTGGLQSETQSRHRTGL